jgi:hypothetical protein
MDWILDTCSHIVEVEVVNYAGNMLHLKSIAQDTFIVSFCPGKPYSTNSIFGDSSKMMAGYWPKPTEKVLVVLNSKYEVILFAKIIGDQYRFWDPNFGFWGSWFSFSDKFTPLEYCGTITYKTRNHCGDGCLISVRKLREYWNVE